MKELDPSSALAFEGAGRVYLARGQTEKAKKEFEEAAEKDPNLWQASGYLGIILDREKKYDEAIVQYRKAIAVHPRSAALFNNLGMSYFYKAEYARAAESFITALKIDPSNRTAQNNLGLALFKLGKYEDALEAFKKGAGEASAQNNMGCLYMSEKNYEKAIRAFEKAIDLNPAYYDKANENLKRAKVASERLAGN